MPAPDSGETEPYVAEIVGPEGRVVSVHIDPELPSDHTGGELLIEHRGQTAEYGGSKVAVSLVAFYADCRHQVLPVKTGSRITLTYNLLLTGDSDTGAEDTLSGELAACLDEHFATPVTLPYGGGQADPPTRLAYLLDHEYTARGLSWSRLKGADAERAALLRAAANRAGCDVVLALAEIQETWDALDSDDADPWHDHDDEEEEENDGTFGYWSGRDVQQREMTLSMGPVKGKDTATGLGPYLVTKDELAPYARASGFDRSMTVMVNGRRYTDADWADVHWSFPQMISYASRGTQVRPGDVIGSGTCGTGCILELSRTHGEEDYPWLKVGDEVVATVEGLGSLRNTIVAADPVHPLQRQWNVSERMT